MTTLLLVRHGLTAMTGPVLAGWTPGLGLDERGRAQAAALADRIAELPLAAIVSSPLDRCVQTAEAVAAGRPGAAGAVRTDDRFGEVHYGDWTGRRIEDLAKEPLWRIVQSHPSAAVFPGADGESLAAAQHRAVAAVRDWNARIAAEHGPDALYAVCSHGDVIKAIVADALGLHLDQFQRIHADPASLTVVRYTELRPFVVRLNDTGGDVSGLVPEPPKEGDRERAGDGSGKAGLGSSDAVVGGGA
ncbi:MSMEG_4193 family putative phosphomutase [Actinomadura sp. WAC 06369]|uniref:MSMEG_4193 family putative phosphomutase n=1 Tax=Actinomadura sp. WAC 06369 TaxID=2203193 RepID=UPI000F79A98D|nr:MSMEG_4193 family putative phosphomutase [Actinomadura sp. WAC 06369]RSN52727.1 phosphoglycerate mutase [Actinomadura sp. WAC 06369]